jgi:hypothetical protein
MSLRNSNRNGNERKASPGVATRKFTTKTIFGNGDGDGDGDGDGKAPCLSVEAIANAKVGAQKVVKRKSEKTMKRSKTMPSKAVFEVRSATTLCCA